MFLLILFACTREASPVPLSPEAVEAWVRPGTQDAEAWGRAVHAGLLAADRRPTEDSVCQVLAVIEQESGYEADPAVPGLGRIAMEELESRASEVLGFLGDDAVGLLLDETAEGAEQSFRARLSAARTERDLDRVFRDLVAHHRQKAPAVGQALDLVAPKLFERLNPVSTAGSMQVKVGWAQEHPVSRGADRESVRDRLYTLEGGVLYGTLRLFDHEAGYEAPIHRFADFNAGQFASRNAAFQEQVGVLTGLEVAPDGDLMAWTDRGRPRWSPDGQTASALLAFGLPEADLKHDLKREKTRGFERTRTWEAVRAAYRDAHGEPAYARVPSVTLDSPKLNGQWTTASFANRVQRRYEDCLKRN